MLTQLLIVLGVGVVAYYALCAWLVFGRGGFGFTYNRVIAWGLGKLGVSGGMTLGSTCYVADRSLLTPEFTAADTPFYRHEVTHFHQWRRRPFTFLPEYLWKLITKGYEHNYFEDDAERAEKPA